MRGIYTAASGATLVTSRATLPWPTEPARISPMNVRTLVGLCLACVCAAVSPIVYGSAPIASSAYAQDAARLSDLRKRAGESVRMCGVVVTARCAERDHVTFLDLDVPYWTDGVSVAISKDKRQLFGPRAEDRFTYRTVCATGRLRRDDDRIAIDVQQPSDVEVVSEPASLMPPLAPSAVRPCDEGVTLPKVTRSEKPSYPSGLQSQGREGIVLLDGVVTAEGTVGDVVVVRAFDQAMGDLAAQAFKRWRFKPGTRNGEPVAVVVGVQMDFKLR